MLNNNITIRDKAIRVDENGLVCLTDIWTTARGTQNQKPFDWWRLNSSKKLAKALLDRIAGNNRNSGKTRFKSIYYSKGAAGTYAHAILACAYSGYLSPKLEVEVRSTWLRFRSGDATLADEILSKATPEANEWAGVRAIGRVIRHRYTDTLKNHGVSRGLDFGICTNETYLALFDASAKDLKKAKNTKGSLRDAMDLSELSYVMASESLASERINEMADETAVQCLLSTRTSAMFIREAIDKDRASRQKKLP